jgi:superfamily II DNA or RNA helicase
MSLTLRGYQMAAVDRVLDALGEKESTLLVLPTGCGKTVVFSEVARRWDGRVLVLAHREELVRQAADKLRDAAGRGVGVEMAAEMAHDGHRAVVASVQTMTRPARRERYARDAFGLIVTDEAHHAVADSYRAVVDYFSPPGVGTRHLGVTATPRRADELALGQVFESVAMEYGITDAVADGYLVPVRQEVVNVEGLDFSAARTLAGDFNEADLDRILREEEILHRVAGPAADLCGDRPALVFCVTVAHAEAMAAVLNRYKPQSARALSGATDRETRRVVVRAFRQGKLQYLCNCALFLEGFDAPGCAAVVMARPTKSLALYTQVLGRGTRPLPGVIDGLSPDTEAARRGAIRGSAKPDLLVLDFAGNAGRHTIVTAADVLGGRYGQEVRRYAVATLAGEGRGAPVDEALARAEAELALAEEERLRLAEQERRRRVVAEVEYSTARVDPFDRTRAAVAGPDDATRPRADPATPKQVGYLVYLGVPRATAAAYGRRQASAVIDKLLRRRGQAG